MSLNPYDDKTYSGYQGSQTPLAVQNQTGVQQSKPQQAAKGPSSPYEAILAHATGQGLGAPPTATLNAPGPTPIPAPAPALTPHPTSLMGSNGDGPVDPSDQPPPPGNGAPPGTTTPPPAPTTGGDTRQHAAPPPVVYSASNPPPRPPDAAMNDPEVAADWYRKFNYINMAFSSITGADVNAYRSNPLGMTFGDWYLAGHRAGEAAPPGPPPTDPGATQPPPGQTPPTNQVQPGSQPNPAPPMPGAPGQGTDWQSVLAQLQKMMNPQFQFESTQLNRNMNAQAALTGDMNSGGYGEVSGRANAQLSADQGNRLSTMFNTDYQNELGRELQKYGIDIGSADSRYTADRGVDAAGLHASAATSAAAMGLQGTMAGLGQQETESKRQWDEYWGNLGLGARGQDYSFLTSLLGGSNQFSPEMLNQGLLGNSGGQFPGYSYFPGVDWTKYFNMSKP